MIKMKTWIYMRTKMQIKMTGDDSTTAQKILEGESSTDLSWIEFETDKVLEGFV